MGTGQPESDMSNFLIKPKLLIKFREIHWYGVTLRIFLTQTLLFFSGAEKGGGGGSTFMMHDRMLITR